MKTYNKGFEIKNYKRTLYDNRRIPFGVKLKIWIKKPTAFIALMFILTGLPQVFIFAPPSAFFEPSFDETDPVTRGIIKDVSGTNSYMNDVRVYEYKYTFNTSDGNQYTGVGYTTGNLESVGNELNVSYKADDPTISQAEGLRRSTFGGGFTFFVWIFPLIGFGLLLAGMRKTIKQIQILKVGELAEGKFINMEPTNTRVNKQTVYKLFFEFKASDGKTYQAVAKTHQTYRLQDEEYEKLVYDPNEPSNAVLLDELPTGIKKYFLKNH